MTRMPDPLIRTLQIQQAVGMFTALLFASLAPASVMAALWSAANIGRSAFVFTLGVAFGHAVLFGLPLFLVCWSKGWVNVATCAVAGFAIGAVPAGALSWPTQHPRFHAAPAMIDTVAGLSGWVRYAAPLMHFGLFGALGGFAFWLVLSGFQVAGRFTARV